MDKKEWDKLSLVEQNKLAAKFGVSRSGENNSIVTEEALKNIPEPKKLEPKDETKKTRKVPAKKIAKRNSGRRTVAKPRRK